MKRKNILFIFLVFFALTTAVHADSNFNFYAGGGIAGLGLVAKGEVAEDEDGDVGMVPGFTGEVFFSYSFFAARASLDIFSLVFITVPVVDLEVGFTFPVKSRFQGYLGVGIGGMQVRFGDEAVFDSPMLMSITAACYLKIVSHFGMGFSCSYMSLFEDFSDTGFLIPRITFGWKL